MMVSVKCYSYLKVLPASKREVLATLRHEHAVYVRPDVALTENIFSIVCCKFFISVFFFFCFDVFINYGSFPHQEGEKIKERNQVTLCQCMYSWLKILFVKIWKRSTIIIHAGNLKQQLFKVVLEKVLDWVFWVNVSGPKTWDWRTPPLTRCPVTLQRIRGWWMDGKSLNYQTIFLLSYILLL